MSNNINIDKIIGFKQPPILSYVSDKDAILYAFSIGYSKDPLNTSDFKYTYELSDNFKTFPTIATVISGLDLFGFVKECEYFPDFNPAMLLHGQQKIIIHKPIKSDMHYLNFPQIYDFIDKKSGGLVILKVDSYYSDNNKTKGELCFTNYYNLFIRGIGGFNYKGKNSPVLSPKIDIKELNTLATVKLNYKTDPNQAIIYRLNGDYNPLHIDPEYAKMGKFDKPILHGLCFYAISCKLIVDNILKGNEAALKSFEAEFTGYVFPGEELELTCFIKNSEIYFRGIVIGRNKQFIAGKLGLLETPKL